MLVVLISLWGSATLRAADAAERTGEPLNASRPLGAHEFIIIPAGNDSAAETTAGPHAEDGASVATDARTGVAGPPWELLERARQAYEYGDYAASVTLARAALRQEMNSEQTLTAYELLGLCLYLQRKYSDAKDAFTNLLIIEPDYQLDPILVPPPIITFFEELRIALAPRLDPIRAARAESARRSSASSDADAHEEQPRVVEVKVRRNYRMLNFLPFGVGQFQNGDSGKAWGVLISEGLLLALNITCYITAKALAGADGRYTRGNRTHAQNLRTTQFTAAGALMALWIYGSVDGFVYFRSETKAGPPTTASVPSEGATSRAGSEAPRLRWTGAGFSVTY